MLQKNCISKSIAENFAWVVHTSIQRQNNEIDKANAAVFHSNVVPCTAITTVTRMMI